MVFKPFYGYGTENSPGLFIFKALADDFSIQVNETRDKPGFERRL
jgi:hypothetical protein